MGNVESGLECVCARGDFPDFLAPVSEPYAFAYDYTAGERIPFASGSAATTAQGFRCPPRRRLEFGAGETTQSQVFTVVRAASPADTVKCSVAGRLQVAESGRRPSAAAS